MSLTPTTPNLPNKDFWKSDSGLYGKIFAWTLAAIACGGVLLFWGLIVPFLLATAANTLGLLCLLMAGAILTAPIWSSSLRRLITIKYELVIRKLTKAMVDDDPIGVLRRNISKLREQGVKFSAAVTQVAQGKKALELDIQNSQAGIQSNRQLAASTDNEIAKAFAMFQSASPASKPDLQLKVERLRLQKGGYERSAGMQIQSIKDEQSILDTTTDMYIKLCRLRDLAEFKVDDLTQQADFYEKRRKVIMGAQAGIAAGKTIIGGDPKELELVEMAVNKLNDETADTLGEMDDFNRWSDRHLTDMDIKNGAAAAEGHDLFAKLDQKLTSGTTVEQVPTAIQGPDGVYATLPNQVMSDDYTKLLK